MGRCKPLGSLNSLLSNAPQLSGTNPVSLLSLRTVRRSDLHSPSSSAIIVGVSGILWIAFWGAHSHVWRTEIADGCDISCLLIWQEIFSFHRLSPGLLHCRQILHHLNHQGSPVFFYTFYLLVFFLLPNTNAMLSPCIYDQNQQRKMSSLLVQ